MATKTFTEKSISRLKAKEKAYKVSLGKNFFLDIRPTGQKIYRVRKGDKTKTLGSTLEMTYENAKICAEQAIAELIDPSLAAKYFNDILDEWLNSKNWASATYHKRSFIITKYLKSFLKQEIRDVKKSEILLVLREIEACGKYETGAKMLSIMKQIFDYALACGYVEINPTTGLSTVIKRQPHKARAAVVSEVDVSKLVNAISRYDSQIVKGLFQFTMFTLCRPSECRLATWDEIEDNIWTIPAARMKMRKDHRVPLARQCVEILEKMEKLKVNKYIFPSLFTSSKPEQALSDGTLRIALRKLGFDKETMSVHGFRSMGSTILNEKGYRHDVIEKALAHAGEDKIRAIYNRAEYFNERRQMLQDYADYLDSLLINN